MISRSWPPTDLGGFGAPGMVTKELGGANGEPYRYIVYVPREYDGVHCLPLIVFLHGADAYGFDGRLQLANGLGPEVWSRYMHSRPFPYFVLFPQARSSWSTDSGDRLSLIIALDRTLAEYRIDADRVYLTGLSSGGEGIWAFAENHPDRWAALVPISCVGSRINIDRIKHLPIRWYQNTADGIHVVRSAVNKLRRAGALTELIEFDDLSHDAWTRAYADPELYLWMNRQVRGSSFGHE